MLHSCVMLRTTVALVSIAVSALWSQQAGSAPRESRFTGNARQAAIMRVTRGQRSLSIIAGGDLSKGAGVQADCELRAVETGRTWRLVPFKSDSIEIGAEDIRGVHFRLRPVGKRAFRIDTDYGDKNCAAGLSFNGTYRLR